MNATNDSAACPTDCHEALAARREALTAPTGRIDSFTALPERLRAAGRRVRVAVACPADTHTEEVILRAVAEGIASFTLVMVEGKVLPSLAKLARASDSSENSEQSAILVADEQQACREAVSEVREGRADVLMKGTVNTDILLRAVLDKQRGLLRSGHVLTHVAITQVPRLGRLLTFTDAAVIPSPTLEQLRAMLGYAADVCRAVVGEAAPRVALTHCTEQTSPKFPVTLSYAQLRQEAAEGAWGSLTVDGPMDVKTALDGESAAIKGIASPVVGRADIIVFPDIEAGNTFYKTLTLLCPTTVVAGMLCGTTAPVVVTSRADTAESKYYSLVAACAKAINNQENQ